MRPRLVALVAGLGAMGSNHLRVLRALDGVGTILAVDPDADRRERATRLHSDTLAFPSVEDALARHRPDIACVAAPVPLLPAVARELVDARVPLLVEKPMAADEREAADLVRRAEERGVLLGVGYVERFNPAVIELKRRLAEGAIGRVHQLHARRLSAYPAREALLGVSLDLATHDIDVMRYLTGSEVARVYAETSRASISSADEDLVCASLRFENGATGLLEVNWLTPKKVRQLTVTGEGGMFVVDYLTQDLVYHENPRGEIRWETLGVVRGDVEGDTIRFGLVRREPLVVQWETFLAALRSGATAPAGGLDGLAALSTAHAVQRSGRTHEAVVPSYRNAVPASR